MEPMVERVSLGFTPPDRAEFQKRLRESIAKGVSEADLVEQKASFVYGNAPSDSRITKDSARHAAAHMRIEKAD